MSIKGYNTKDTIAAIATFPSASALGIIKVSGKNAVSAVRRVFLPKRKGKDIKKVKSYTLHYGWIMQPSGESHKTRYLPRRQDKIIDEVLVSVMRAPHSYTREDVVEISSHGGVLILNKILELLLKSGARLARPGEFSYRAFLNGRIDLTQVQAIADIIDAKTEKAMFSLSCQLKGDFSSYIGSVKNDLEDTLSLIEACIDFPEDNTEIDLKSVEAGLKNMAKEIKDIIDKESISKILRDGARCVICGPANVGKSTLFNRIIKEERALVTRVPGTTRDAIDDIINIKGLPLRVYDTAGILRTKNFIDREAMKKSYKKIEEADLVIFMFDASRRVSKINLSLVEKIKHKNMILIINKIDLPNKVKTKVLKHFNKPIVRISALRNMGLEKLEKAIFNTVYKDGFSRKNNMVIFASWQIQILKSTLFYINEAEEIVKDGFSIDFVSAALKGALDNLCKISGENVSEELLDNIFSNLCIGK